jgi:uncharacterized membrane protein
MNSENSPTKTIFPTDRVNNFCDAVFAIAMTLLILEIKIPSLDDLKTLGTGGVLIRLIPSFVGFFVSFLVTALYWRAHLILARHVKEYTSKLFWLTVWLLMSVVLLPFSTALYSKFFNFNGPFIFYCLNLFLIGIINYRMIAVVVKENEGTLSGAPLKLLRFRALSASVVWVVSALWVFVEPYSARALFLVIFVVQYGYERRLKKKGY